MTYAQEPTVTTATSLPSVPSRRTKARLALAASLVLATSLGLHATLGNHATLRLEPSLMRDRYACPFKAVPLPDDTCVNRANPTDTVERWYVELLDSVPSPR